MRALIPLHRWFGVAFCLLFAMWFASGMIMHWVEFPNLDESERSAGLTAFDASACKLTPSQALSALKRDDIARLRLSAAAGRPLYVATSVAGEIAALDAATGAPPAVDAAYALASAQAHAHARGIAAQNPVLIETAMHDQWSVSNGLDAHRPLYRIALNDAAGTEHYVSSLTGEVVRDTTQTERVWNVAGSVLHWIYPTELRKHRRTWIVTVWILAFVATLGALGGAVLGVLRLRNMRSPFRGWMYWHHVLGLACATFVLTWIFSGWLSMDSGQMFSSGRPDAAETAQLSGLPLNASDVGVNSPAAAGLHEIEWFRFGGRALVRSIDASGVRHLGGGAGLSQEDIARAAARLGAGCTVGSDADAYAAHSRAAGLPVYRIVCGDNWYQIDGADGRVIEKLDASRRAYRWAFRALHTLDFPALADRPALRSGLIMLLCGGGFFFSLTGVVIGWRRLKRRTGVI